jgi:hypothetical protein
VAQLQYLVDTVADRLPSWQASMLDRVGRLELVRSTLAAMSIFTMMSLDVQILCSRSRRSSVASCGKAVRMRMVATVLWRGTKFVCQRSLGVLVSQSFE